MTTKQIVVGFVLIFIINPVWVLFDYLIDPSHFKIFLALRTACMLVNMAGLFIFLKCGQQAIHHRKFGLVIYISTILTILPMCLITSQKYPYYIGFSTLFWCWSIILVWPLRYFLIPMFLAGLVLGIGEWYYSADPVIDVTALFLMFNVCTLSGVASWRNYQNYLTNRALMTELEELSNTDRLTGLNNRRYFDLRLSDELAHAARNSKTTTVMLLDVDHFKKYNDHYGHPQGDACLRQVGACLAKAISRETDFVARYGGEEFVVVLPDTDHAGAEIVAQRIVDTLRGLELPHCQSPVAPFVTASIGIACCQGLSAEQMIATADAALYLAKLQGRNRFVWG